METPTEYFQRRRDVISERLNGRCRELEVSQHQLARMLGVDHRQVWDWFNARHAPSDPYLRRLEAALDVPRDYFTASVEEPAA